MRSKQEIRGIVESLHQERDDAALVLRETQDSNHHAGLLAPHSKKQAEAGRGHGGNTTEHRIRARASLAIPGFDQSHRIGILGSRGTVPESEALETGGPSRTLGWLRAAAGGKQIPPAQRLSGDFEIGVCPR